MKRTSKCDEKRAAARVEMAAQSLPFTQVTGGVLALLLIWSAVHGG